MKNTHKLFESFGELIYVVAMADGIIQKEELAIIEEKLSKHKWGKEIKWSFDYEVKKKNAIEDLYKKVVFYCEDHGPDEEYDFLLDVLNELAKSSNGKVNEEKEMITSFVNDLTLKFKEDLDRINEQ